MQPRPVKVERQVDEVLLFCRQVNQSGGLGNAEYHELLTWFDRVCGELAIGFDQFGTRVRSLKDFFAGRVTRTRTEMVARSPLTLTAALDTRTQTVWVISLSAG